MTPHPTSCVVGGWLTPSKFALYTGVRRALSGPVVLSLALGVLGCGFSTGEPLRRKPPELPDAGKIEPLQEGLVGWWKLDELDATANAIDSSSEGNDGIPVNAPPHVATTVSDSGRASSARAFDGQSQYFRIPHQPSLDIEGEITLAAWVLLQKEPSGCSVILARGYRASPVAEIALRLGGSDCFGAPDTVWVAGVYDGAGDHFAGVPIAPDIGRWAHLAATFDGANWRLYRNGVVVSELASSAGAFVFDADWGLGARAPSSVEPLAAERFFSGVLADVRLYRRALSGLEVKQLAEL